jgi:4-hydroxy-tetrahydrodipicolinate reductase
MKIAIIGYGKMGKLIEKVAKKRGADIFKVFNDSNWTSIDLQGADVAIEFSSPESAVGNIRKSIKANVPIVVGTTGWYNDFDKVKHWVLNYDSALLAATNFSIGVNIFYEINKKLASLMNFNPSYKPVLMETHHKQKLDSPSGTAITIAKQIIDEMNEYNKWEEAEIIDDKTIQVITKREENIPGTHKVTYANEIDEISISHKAKNRNGFALGAVIAAEFLAGKKGVYSMSDIIKL